MAASHITFRNDHIDSPYFIFIRGQGPLTDRDILNALALQHVRPSQVDTREERSLFITGDGTWLHIADCWFYSLWHAKVESRLTARLPMTQIFTCSVGDCDYSFDFHYYVNGQVRRAYQVGDPAFNRSFRHVIRDKGEPFVGEKPLSEIECELDYVLSLAANLGVQAKQKVDEIRCYQYGTSDGDG